MADRGVWKFEWFSLKGSHINKVRLEFKKTGGSLRAMRILRVGGRIKNILTAKRNLKAKLINWKIQPEKVL